MAEAERALHTELETQPVSKTYPASLDAASLRVLPEQLLSRRTRLEEQTVLGILQDGCTAMVRLETFYANRRLLAVVAQHQELRSLTRGQALYVKEAGLYVHKGLR